MDHLPEQHSRLEAVLQALHAPTLGALTHLEPLPVTDEDLLRVHTGAYVESVMSLIPAKGFWALDDETIISSGSGRAALHASGCVTGALAAVMENEATNAFCAIRPPGHHASAAASGGFCIFNNIAIGARKAKNVFGLERVAIIDFDAHRCDGTQEIFWGDRDVLVICIHQIFTELDRRSGDQTGLYNNIMNFPLEPGSGGSALRALVTDQISARLSRFKPDIMFVSAGFDGHKDDPLCQLEFNDDDFGWLSRELVSLAETLCQGRIVAALEGGYDLNALAASVTAFIKPMMNKDH